MISSIPAALNAPLNAGDSFVRKEEQALFLLREAKVRVLIIDELLNILADSSDKLNQMLNLLRFLGNELQIWIVSVGVKETLQVVNSDDQLSNRFEPFPLPRWRKPHSQFETSRAPRQHCGCWDGLPGYARQALCLIVACRQ